MTTVSQSPPPDAENAPEPRRTFAAAAADWLLGQRELYGPLPSTEFDDGFLAAVQMLREHGDPVCIELSRIAARARSLRRD